MVLVMDVRRVAGSHATGGTGVLARSEMEFALRGGEHIANARARDPFLLEEVRRLAWEWTRRVEDEAREALTSPLLAACEAALNSGRAVAPVHHSQIYAGTA
ncbi:MAG: hypothetical protein COB49_01855 [Alphaproteobacteria bacterium]|nr:MAG: hypothetical protein COB49_01855 [Alphaproteobacteria bacterium]